MPHDKNDSHKKNKETECFFVFFIDLNCVVFVRLGLVLNVYRCIEHDDSVRLREFFYVNVGLLPFGGFRFMNVHFPLVILVKNVMVTRIIPANNLAPVVPASIYLVQTVYDQFVFTLSIACSTVH